MLNGYEISKGASFSLKFYLFEAVEWLLCESSSDSIQVHQDSVRVIKEEVRTIQSNLSEAPRIRSSF
jgi:hypothetical protein